MTTPTEDRWAFLSPWTALLREHKLRVKTAFLNQFTCREEFQAIELELQPSVMEDEAAHAQHQSLAEAMELVATALALFPDAWHALIVHQCGCHWFNPELYDQDTLVPRFDLNCAFYPGEVLVATASMRFFQVLQDSTRRSAPFVTAKQHLLAMAGGGRTPSFAPVPLRIAVSTWNELPRNFLAGHAAFLRQLKRGVNGSSWCYVEAVAFDITGADMSSDAIKQCLLLARESPLVQFTRLTVDPKEISCSSHELTELITTFVSTTPMIHLHLGDLAFDSSSSHSESHVVQGELASRREGNVGLMMEAIAKAPVLIKTLTIGRLMSRESTGLGGNTSVWNRLLCTLLHSSSACTVENLELVSDWTLRVDDEEAPVELVASVRSSLKIPQSLTLKTASLHTAGLIATIRTVGSSLCHLRISCSEHQSSSNAVPSILEMCPNLKHLDLNNVALDSLDVFSTGKTTCRLSTLTLTNTTLRNHASVSKFFTYLADPQSLLGRELGEFVFTPAQDQPLLGSRELSQADQILRRNGRLHTLQLEVNSSTSETLRLDVTREHRQPAAVFEAPLALSNKLAFLSALVDHQSATNYLSRSKLCEDVVPLVFGYAAKCTPRWVNVIPR